MLFSAEMTTRKRSPAVWERRQEEIRKQRQKLKGESSILIEDSDDEFYVPGAPRSGRYFDISSAPTVIKSDVTNVIISTYHSFKYFMKSDCIIFLCMDENTQQMKLFNIKLILLLSNWSPFLLPQSIGHHISYCIDMFWNGLIFFNIGSMSACLIMIIL